jgi:hypothetical protein
VFAAIILLFLASATKTKQSILGERTTDGLFDTVFLRPRATALNLNGWFCQLWLKQTEPLQRQLPRLIGGPANSSIILEEYANKAESFVPDNSESDTKAICRCQRRRALSYDRDMSFRLWVAGLAFGATLLAQQGTQQSSTWTIDANGQRVEGPRYTAIESPQGSQRVETAQSINGRMVPIQSAEDRVLRQDPQRKEVERIIRKYDATGNPGPPVKVRIEETKNADGSTTIQSTTYEADINGNLKLFERATTQIRKGDTTETSTTVERATLNGSLQTTERSTSLERKTGSGSEIDSTTYRRDVSGNFTPLAQDVKRTSKSGAEETTDAAHYVVDPNGKLTLASRAIDHVKTNPDGSQVSETDVYSKFSAGNTGDANAGEPRLQQQVRRERTPGPGGAVVETTSVRARLPNDPSSFGAYEKTSQVTYTSTDASGREVKTIETSASRRDANGQIVVDQGRVDRSVVKKQ